MDHVTEFRSALVKALPSSAYLLEDDARQAYESDWRGIVKNPSAAILLPGSTADVSAMVSLCAAHGIAVVPQGGNTGLAAGAVPVAHLPQAVLSLRRMQAIRSIDPVNNTMEIEAGVVLQTAQEEAARVDRLLPLSLAAEGSCQIGGTIATNAGGIHVLSYGSMRNLVLGLEVVLPDGRIWNGLRSLRKDNTGIDLKHVFIGSEGILGIITAAALRMLPRPKKALTVLAACDSAHAALRVFLEAQQACGSDLTSCEYLTQIGLDLVLDHLPASRPPFDERYPAYVLMEMSSLDAAADLSARLEPLLMRLHEGGTVLDVAVAQSESQRMALWQLRESLSEGERAAGGAVKHDVAVPVAAIPQTIADIEHGLPKVAPGARLNIFGHLGDGNLHVNVMPPARVAFADFLAQARQVTAFIEEIVVGAGGTFSAEHGIGQLRVESLKNHRAPLELELMRAIKGAIDPRWMMNPGKVLNRSN
ncbi:MAG: FAD-binding oxidoreductase [Mesorhizobium sp.]